MVLYLAQAGLNFLAVLLGLYHISLQSQIYLSIYLSVYLSTDKVSSSPACPSTGYVAENDLQLLILLPPLEFWITSMYHHAQPYFLFVL